VPDLVGLVDRMGSGCCHELVYRGGMISSRYSTGDGVSSCGDEARHDEPNSTSAMVKPIILEVLRILTTFSFCTSCYRD